MADTALPVRDQEPPGGWDTVPPSADRVPDRRGVLIVSGVLAIGAGLVAIVVPAVASVGTAVFIGCMLIAAGIAIACGVFAVAGAGRKVLTGLAAIASLAVGIYLLASPLDGTFTLTVMLVVWFVVVGVARIGVGIAHRSEPDAAYSIAAGVVSLGLGVLIGVELPSSADWAIGLLVGIDFLVYGALALGRAWLPRDA